MIISLIQAFSLSPFMIRYFIFVKDTHSMCVKNYCSLLLLALITSCRFQTNHNADANLAGDSLSYIRFNDAKVLDPSWRHDNVVIAHIISEPDNLHPTNGNTAIRAELLLYTQMMLVQTDMRNPGLRTGLCKAMPTISPDGLQYTFELRDEPKWDDGTLLSVDDIIFTAKANKCPLVHNPSGKPYWRNVQNIIVDPANNRNFTVVMRTPYIQNIAFWSDFPIMQRKFHDPQNVLSGFTYDQMDNDLAGLSNNTKLNEWANQFNDQKYGFDPTYLNGLGMYKVEKWETGQYVSLVRKSNHWTASSKNYYEQALPSKIIFKLNRDAASTLLELKSQNMDASGYASAKTLLELQGDTVFKRNYNSRFLDTYGFTYVAMNTRPDGVLHKKLFVDVRVRKAMAMLAPVDDMINIVNKGLNKRITGPISFLKKEYNQQLPIVKLDIQQARKLLDDAGWKDTDGDNVREKIIDGKRVNFEFDFYYLTTQAEWKNMADIICEGLMAGGLKANAVPLDQTAMFAKAHNHDFDMMMASLATTALPEDFRQAWHTSSWTSNGSNYSGFGNAESDSLIDKISVTLKDDERVPLLKEFQRIVYVEQPVIFLYALVRRNILHKRWGNDEMYYDRPGMLYNNLRLLSGVSAKDEVSN